MAKNLKRILTGIQSTGVPHMGNILGAILPAINFSKQKEIESYLFIADFHSLTQIKDSKTLKENTLYTAYLFNISSNITNFSKLCCLNLNERSIS